MNTPGQKIYQTPEEIAEARRLHPDVTIPDDALAVQVTVIAGKPHVEVVRPNPGPKPNP